MVIINMARKIQKLYRQNKLERLYKNYSPINIKLALSPFSYNNYINWVYKNII